MDDYAEHLRVYFGLGIKYQDILECYAIIYGIVMSMSSLKRQLKWLGLFRRKYYTDVLKVMSFILENLSGSAQSHEYKIMHLKCLQNGYKVTQETVHLLLHILDPEGVKFRSCNRLRRRLYSNLGQLSVAHRFLWQIVTAQNLYQWSDWRLFTIYAMALG